MRCKWNGKHQEKKKEAGFRRQRIKGNLCAVEERLADTEREKGVMGGAMVGRGIEAGDGIEAGWGIKAGEGIEAGDDYGIFAGVKIKVGSWEIGAKVIAKSKPQNLISGFWIEPDAEEK